MNKSLRDILRKIEQIFKNFIKRMLDDEEFERSFGKKLILTF